MENWKEEIRTKDSFFEKGKKDKRIICPVCKRVFGKDCRHA